MSAKLRSIALVVVLLVVGVAAWVVMQSAQAQGPKADARVFELRTYTAKEGKLDALKARFRDHTVGLFKKHGMTQIGYWAPTEEPKSKNTLVYLLAFPTAEAREKSWAAFRADPDWQKALADSEKENGGKLTEKTEFVVLTPTDFSQMQ
jgi:type II secretory pathway pseudopilin PulG